MNNKKSLNHYRNPRRIGNCSDAVHLCSANFSHQSVRVAAVAHFFQRKMADDFLSVNRNVSVNIRHRQSLQLQHVFVCQPRM